MAARHCLGTHTHTLTDTQFVVTFCQAVLLLLLLLTALSTDDCIESSAQVLLLLLLLQIRPDQTEKGAIQESAKKEDRRDSKSTKYIASL